MTRNSPSYNLQSTKTGGAIPGIALCILSSLNTTHFKYDGNGDRIQQTVNSIATDYLLDVQPGLTKVIAASSGANTKRFVHTQQGIHAVEDPDGDWFHPLVDGLGSVRMETDDMLAVQGMQDFDPYGEVIASQGDFSSPFGFTGEQTDDSGMSFLRARYYNPETGAFTALDPFEGVHDRPMSLNGYSLPG